MKSLRNITKSINRELFYTNNYLYSNSLDDEEEINNIKDNKNEQFINLDFNDTSEIKISNKLIDQVLGQDEAVNIIKKAALQHRHVIMIGIPGTGKSLLAKAMTELLPSEKLEDILVYPNTEDINNPLIRCVPSGKGKIIISSNKKEIQKKSQTKMMLLFTLMIGIGIYTIYWGQLLFGIIICLLLVTFARQFITKDETFTPKLLVSNDKKNIVPFIDATAAHAGALLGDVRHDPFQSGGLETPAHERVEAGAIHKANKGVLFIDEINTLGIESQQNLLTALQEKEYPITGQSERSSGALVKTEPVPCDFIMVAAGNMDALDKMHPALRSRIKGSGYEVYMKDSIRDTLENREKYVYFVAQEVFKAKNIPHFDKSAVIEIIKEARIRSGRKGYLTLKLRDLGGLIRIAGDICISEGKNITTSSHVILAKKMARSIEQQYSDRYIERKKENEEYYKLEGNIGRVNGLAVIGEDAGLLLPIVASVSPSMSSSKGDIIVTGQLKKIARESVLNISAVIKKITGKSIDDLDIHVQFIGTYDGVEGDSASISMTVAIVSAYKNIPIIENLAMTGSLSVRGDVLPIGGVNYKIEAAIKSGMKKVIIPLSNNKDIILPERLRNNIEIITVKNIIDVFDVAFVNCKEKNDLINNIKNYFY